MASLNSITTRLEAVLGDLKALKRTPAPVDTRDLDTPRKIARALNAGKITKMQAAAAKAWITMRTPGYKKPS
jgi:hypothetical protein